MAATVLDNRRFKSPPLTIANADQLSERARSSAADWTQAAARARRLVRAQRQALQHDWVAALLHEYGLTTSEGIRLMRLAEAYLRIPDGTHAALLLREVLS